MTGDAKPNEKLFYILARLKETRVSAVEKAGYVRVTIQKLKKIPSPNYFFGGDFSENSSFKLCWGEKCRKTNDTNIFDHLL